MGFESPSNLSTDPERFESKGFRVSIKPPDDYGISEVVLYRGGAIFETIIRRNTGEILSEVRYFKEDSPYSPAQLIEMAREASEAIQDIFLSNPSAEPFWSTPEAERIKQAQQNAEERRDGELPESQL